MALLCPLPMLAAGTGSAILHSKGGVFVNGAEAADAITVFAGDLIETKPGFVANLDTEGSSVLIQPESLVKFENDFLSLEHGSVSVGTSTAMAVHVKCLKVEPVAHERTLYDVSDRSGMAHVEAHKQDVNIIQGTPLRKAASPSSSSLSATVHEGEQTTRDESVCGATRPTGAGNGLNTKWIEIGGGIGGGALVLCLLLCKSSGPSSISQDQP